MEEASWRSHHGGVIMEEASWRSHHRGDIMEEASWRRYNGGGIVEEASWRRHQLSPVGGIWEASGTHLEASGASGRHPRGIWDGSGSIKRHLRGMWEASGRHLGGIWRHRMASGAYGRHLEASGWP